MVHEAQQTQENGNGLHKSDRDAMEPEVPHEWSSDQNLVPAGPFLQYLGLEDGRWLGSVMIVLPPSNMHTEDVPMLTFSAGGPSQSSAGVWLDAHDGWSFWRFNISVQMISQEQPVEYSVSIPGKSSEQARYTFYVPAIHQPMHWGFHSCNGLSVNSDIKVWGKPLLWKDVLKRHQDQHLHLMVGGGDQIYNDGFWKTEPFQAWLNTSGNKERLEHPFTLEMEQCLNSWVLNHYRQHYTHELFRELFATIPQVGQKDDHDIFDGWGSYPEHLQNCPVFQGTFTVLNRFFLLFQMHTTAERAYSDNNMFGTDKCYTFLRMMGPSQAMLVPDTRGERTRYMVMSEEHYNQIFERCAQLPGSVNHLVVVLTVPIVYPKLPLSQTVLTAVEGMPFLKGAMTKTGVGAGIIDKFHHVELLDDIEDHWDSSTHEKEREAIIHRFQEHAKLTRQRVSFISGDVHCGQVGRLYTTPKMKHLQHDYRFMPQVTSSAIWNNPPPDVLLNLLTRLDKARKFDKNTREKTVRLFRDLHPKSPKLIGGRNWCEVTEMPASVSTADTSSRQAGSLIFSLRVENPQQMEAEPEIYTVPVPTYVPPKSNAEKRMTYRSRQWGNCFSKPASLSPLEEF